MRRVLGIGCAGAIAACSLFTDLDGFSARESIVFVGSDGSATLPDGAIASPAEGGGTPAPFDARTSDVTPTPASYCEGTKFCSLFADQTLKDWDNTVSYGGGLRPLVVAEQHLSPPFGLALTMPRAPEGGGTVIKVVSQTRVDRADVEMAILPIAFAPAPTTILKLAFGSTVFILNAHAGGLYVEAIGQAPSPTGPLPPAGAWSRMALTIAGGQQNTGTLRINDVSVFDNHVFGTTPFGEGLTIELGVVYAAGEQPEVHFVVDDFRVR